MTALLLLFLCILLGGCTPKPSTLTLQVSPATTTPQLPWLMAEKEGSLHSIETFKRLPVHSSVLLQNSMLSGQGELWIASVETAARARNAGAPIQLLAIVGWRKWVLIGNPAAANWQEAIASHEIWTAPQGNPAQSFLQNLAQQQHLPIGKIQQFNPQHLIAALLQSNEPHVALLAEPMASRLLQKGAHKHLKVLASLEQIKQDTFGGEAALPWAALVINEKLLKSHPRLPQALLNLLQANAQKLNQMEPDAIAEFWPPEYEDTLSKKEVADSLAKDLIRILPACNCLDDIQEFLKFTAPDLPWDTSLAVSAACCIPQKSPEK